VKSGEEKESYDGLSQREREVLQLIAEGYTSQEVAKRLFLSPKTVETYRSRIADKLGIRHRAELVKYALRKGLLRSEQ
jgi:two-component system response regulator NreC